MTIDLSYAAFESAARAVGYTEVLTREWEPGRVVAEHIHPHCARGLIVAGEMWLTVGGETQHLRAGDGFEVPHGTPHTERFGSEGATGWAARRPA